MPRRYDTFIYLRNLRVKVRALPVVTDYSDADIPLAAMTKSILLLIKKQLVE
jgi:hypothetical protein